MKNIHISLYDTSYVYVSFLIVDITLYPSPIPWYFLLFILPYIWLGCQELLRHGGHCVSGSSLNNGLHSIEIDVARNLFNLYKTDYLQWHSYTLFPASWNQSSIITFIVILVGTLFHPWYPFRHLIRILRQTGCWLSVWCCTGVSIVLIVICFAVVIMTDDRINPPPSSEWLIWHHDCPSGSVGQTLWNPVWPGSIDFKPPRRTAGHNSRG